MDELFTFEDYEDALHEQAEGDWLCGMEAMGRPGTFEGDGEESEGDE